VLTSISNNYQHAKDLVLKKTHKGRRRNKGWRKLRNAFVKGKTCEVCGSKKKLEVHHILPFHMYPLFEMEPTNLMVLCDGSNRYGIKSCHLAVGHLGNYRRSNIDSFTDAMIIRQKLLDCT